MAGQDDKSVVDLIGFRESLIEGLSEALKAATKEEVKELTKGTVAELVKDVTSEAAGAFLGAFAKSLLKLVLRQQDKIAQLSIQLSALIRAPLLTGTRVANDALQCKALTEKEVEFRERRLTFAAEQLDQALTHLSPATSIASATFYVYLLQTLCYGHIRGALHFAEIAWEHAGAIIEIACPDSHALRGKCPQFFGAASDRDDI